MIAVLAQRGSGDEALRFLRLMDLDGADPCEVTFVSVVDACSSLGDLSIAKMIDDVLTEAGFAKIGVLGNAVINMYGSCGSLRDAWKAFEQARIRRITSQEQDIVPWNAMIGILSRNGQSSEAFRLFQEMELEGIKPEAITVVSVLDSCSLSNGMKVHSSILGSRLENQIRIQNALVSIYSRNGCLRRAREVFDAIADPDVVSWSAIVAAYANVGCSSEAFDVFREMILRGEIPDSVTFVVILAACAHSGLLDAGVEFFLVMRQDHFVEPNVDHFVCVADLLGRAGKIEMAEDLLEAMPFEPAPAAWISLLACSRTANEFDRTLRISNKCLAMENAGSSSVPYVLLSNASRIQHRIDLS